jgi:peptidoglycan/xylan/chitin deacetylase (PgdA/CDA1 family)
MGFCEVAADIQRHGGATSAALCRTVCRLSTHGAIVCFHGVVPTGQTSAGILHIPAAEFNATMLLLRTWGEIVPLRDLVDLHRRGKRSRGLFAVTFDDAYASLVDTVLPSVDRTQTPITIFACSGALERGQVFWWDRLEDLHARVAPARWTAFEHALRLPPRYRAASSGQPGSLERLRRWIMAEHRGRWPARLEVVLAGLEEEVACTTPHRGMSLEELEAAAQRPWVDVGVHTVSHPVLPSLSDEDARQEILQCFRDLSERCPRTLRYLGIPYGIFDRRTARVAREAGMTMSFSAECMTLSRSVEPQILPRVVLTARQKPWKLALRVFGLYDQLRGPRVPGYPEWPT